MSLLQFYVVSLVPHVLAGSRSIPHLPHASTANVGNSVIGTHDQIWLHPQIILNIVSVKFGWLLLMVGASSQDCVIQISLSSAGTK